jgi:hypothetical protein
MPRLSMTTSTIVVPAAIDWCAGAIPQWQTPASSSPRLGECQMVERLNWRKEFRTNQQELSKSIGGSLCALLAS